MTESSGRVHYSQYKHQYYTHYNYVKAYNVTDKSTVFCIITPVARGPRHKSSTEQCYNGWTIMTPLEIIHFSKNKNTLQKRLDSNIYLMCIFHYLLERCMERNDVKKKNIPES